jgi:4-oxalocrotonate tautomerase
MTGTLEMRSIATRVLGKDPSVTSIAIEYVDPEDWIVGGKSLSEQKKQRVLRY